MVMVLVSTVAEAAIAPAMISAWICRLCASASIRPARNCERYRMHATSATRPARLSETMRLVRLEKESAKKNWPARCSQPSGQCQPLRPEPSAAVDSRTRAGEAPSLLSSGSGSVRSSKGQTTGCFDASCDLLARRAYPIPRHSMSSGRRRQSTMCALGAPDSGFLEAVPNPVKSFDHLEIVIGHFEFFAQPLDVAVDRAVVDVDLIVVGGIHQGIAAFHIARARS